MPESFPSPEDGEQVDLHLAHQRRSTIFRRGRRRQSTIDTEHHREPGRGHGEGHGHGHGHGHEHEPAHADSVGRPEDHVEPHTELDLGEETAVERAEREMMDHEADADARRRMDDWDRDAVKIRAYDTDWNEWGEDAYESDEVGFGDVPAGFAWDGTFPTFRKPSDGRVLCGRDVAEGASR